MAERVRVGLIGAGGISRAHVAGYVKHQDRVTVPVIADVNPHAGAVAAKSLGENARVAADWREVVRSPDIEAVDICLPHDLHAEVAVAAADAGKHVLVEKPIARTLEEADAMIAAARRGNVKLMVCHDRRYVPMMAKIKELIDGGAIGDLTCIRLDHNQSLRLNPQHWIFQKERLGGGAVISCLTHQIDLIRWFGGDVSEVAGMSVTIPDRMEGEVIGLVPMRMRSGAVADAVINWAVEGRTAKNGLWYELIWISGTKGNLHNQGGLYVMGPEGTPGDYYEVPVEAERGHINAIAHFADCVANNKDPLTNGEEGRAALAVALAAYESERDRRFVSL